jgi:hypothetical protein
VDAQSRRLRLSLTRRWGFSHSNTYGNGNDATSNAHAGESYTEPKTTPDATAKALRRPF